LSSPSHESDDARVRDRVLDLYTAVTVLMLLGIAVLVAYVVRLGTLTGPGVQESFGLALALMFLMAAVVAHVMDRTYRSWPLGRRFRPAPPGPVTVEGEVRLLKVLVVVLAGAAIAYVLGGLIA
jgi:hypothetical protein